MTDIRLDIPEEFYKDEIRYDYLVTSDMKKVWAVELDLLYKLLEVCEKYGLKCYADAGTLIGAVRHKGFIPWDDDIDVVMFRDDYDKLAAVAEKEFKEPYFFQNAYTDETYTIGHAQIRNSYTTAILPAQRKKKVKYNCGIFLDIFILDGVTDNKVKLRMQKFKSELLKRLMLISIQNKFTTKKEKIANKMLKLFKLDKKALYSMFEKNLRSVSVKDCQYVAPLSFIFETTIRKRNKHFYDDIVLLDYEMFKIPAPSCYHEFLTHRFGDYMKPKKFASTHGEVFFDVDKPYGYYMNSEK